ncbi:LysR family substrate-binding domain-containing protein [Streptomyces sp. NPDC094143]|uniref:LysR family substrate-binding domain-containing protein n=1 Tax=Streptomyces sp. NPDC094143 TaxID=3155310 RepID=UPI00331C7D7B
MNLTALHRRLLADILAVGGAYRLVLTGGYALPALGLVDRLSRDLDCATENPEPMERIGPRCAPGWRTTRPAAGASPGTTVQLVDLLFGDHMAALAQQEVDVVFLRPPVTDDIELHHLATEPRVACLSATHPLANRPGLTLAQLAGIPVVAMPDQVPRLWWDFWAVDPRPDGSRVRYGPVATDMESLLHMVAAGEAMCLLPSAARDYFSRPGITYLDVVDLAPSTSALAWLRRRRSEATIRAIRHAAQEATRQAFDIAT